MRPQAACINNIECARVARACARAFRVRRGVAMRGVVWHAMGWRRVMQCGVRLFGFRAGTAQRFFLSRSFYTIDIQLERVFTRGFSSLCLVSTTTGVGHQSVPHLPRLQVRLLAPVFSVAFGAVLVSDVAA